MFISPRASRRADLASDEEYEWETDDEDDQDEEYKVLSRATMKAQSQAFTQVKLSEQEAEKPKKKKLVKKKKDGSSTPATGKKTSKPANASASSRVVAKK